MQAFIATNPISPDAAAIIAATGAPRLGQRVIHWEHFNPAAENDWDALLRDVAALANSGGGRLVVNALLDNRELLARFQRATASTFEEVEVKRPGAPAGNGVSVEVGAAAYPLHVVSREGRVAAGFYFLRGGKAELGTTADMRAFVERLLNRVRRRWSRRIKRVLAEPVVATPDRPPRAERQGSGTRLQPVRIVTDPDAPALQPQDVDRLYPWRQKDLLRELNRRLGRRVLTSYDIQAIRRHHRLDQRPDFVFNLPGAGRRYTPAVADWIMAAYGADPEFFLQTRLADQIAMKSRRQKPR